MNSRSFLFPVFPIFLPLLFLILVTSYENDYEWFLNCKDPLNCNQSVLSEGLPLWKGTGNCGYDEPETMKVDCAGRNATIEILGANYQLLGFSTIDEILIISEIDFLAPDRFCSPKHHIPSNSIYAMLPVTNDCGLDNPTCSRTELSYKTFENLTANGATTAAFCLLTSIVVPISPSLLEQLGGGEVWPKVANQIIQEFKTGRKVDGQECRSCSVYGGVCGYDLISNQTRCYCQTKLPTKRFELCHPPPSPPYAKTPETELDSDETKKSKKTTSLIIGVSIGGTCLLVATILGCCFCYCLRRRNKKHQIESISKQSHSPLVSDQTDHNIISSYNPSSKCDLERATTNHIDIIQVFNYDELEKATDNFNQSRELGDGGFGTVYYGKLVDGRKVAVKRLYEHNCKRVEQFINEVDILAHLQHNNLVKLYGCTSRFSQGLLLVYEYIPNGTVADHLHGSRANFGLLSWPIRLRIATETANALAYLHHSEIIHRDVKTNNILLDNNFTVKVADFGLSRLFPTDVTHVSTAPQGTPGYVDPEYYQCYQLTSKSDVYSFGVVLIELISSLRAVDVERKRHDINLSNMAVSKIQTGALNELIDPKLGFDKNHEVTRAITIVAELAFRCLQQERDMRPSMEEVVEVLREIENDKSSFGMAKVVDIGVVGDDIERSKRTPPSLSPNSVIANNWVSSSSTTNSL